MEPTPPAVPPPDVASGGIGIFLFGSGWMVMWHLLFYGGAALMVGVPMWQMREYVKAGKPAGPAGLGTMAVMMMVSFYLGFVTLVDMWMLGRVLEGSWLHIAMLALTAATVASLAPWLMGYPLVTEPKHFAFAWFFGTAVALTVANLVVLYIRATHSAGEFLFRPTGLAKAGLIIGSLPAMLVVGLLVLGMVITPLRAMKWRNQSEPARRAAPPAADSTPASSSEPTGERQ